MHLFLSPLLIKINWLSFQKPMSYITVVMLLVMIKDWAIPENIHTIPRTAFRISEGEGGSRLWNSEGMGGYL